jgi:hypothetical protein
MRVRDLRNSPSGARAEDLASILALAPELFRNRFNFTLSDLGPIAAIAVPALTAIWFIAQLSSNVSNIQSDVKEINVKADQLVRDGARGETRVENLEGAQHRWK